MPRTGESSRNFVFSYCECRPDQPYRAKQVSTHRKLNPSHKFGEKFRLCLGCLVELPYTAKDMEVIEFLKKHEGHEHGQSVNSKKSREYFAARKTTVYLKSRQQSTIEPKVDLDATTSSAEEDGISEGEEDPEIVEAIANIETAVPDKTDHMEVTIDCPAPRLDESIWIDHAQMLTDLGEETPLQAPQVEEYKLDLADIEDFNTPLHPELADIFSQKVAPTKAQPFKAPTPPKVTSELEAQTVFEVGSADWSRQNRLSLQGRICDRDANLRTLQGKLQQAEGKIAALEKNLTAFQAKELDLVTREKLLRSTELILNNATEKVEQRQKANEEEKQRLQAEKERLKQQDIKLGELGKQLKAFRTKISATKDMTLHIPCGRDGIMSDPSTEGCVINSGEACGHLQIKASFSNGIKLVSYYNTRYNKRPPTTALHHPPAVKIKQQK